MSLPVILFSVRPDFIQLPEQVTTGLQHFTHMRSLKKALRSEQQGIFILDLHPADNTHNLESLVHFIRQGTANPYMKIIVLLEDHSQLSVTELYQQYHVDEVVELESFNSQVFQVRIQRLWQQIQTEKSRQIKSEQQLKLLTSVNQFVHSRQPLFELIQQFTQTLSQFSRSTLTLKVDLYKDKISKVAFCDGDIVLPAPILAKMRTTGLKELEANITSLKSPQVELNIPQTLQQQLLEAGLQNTGCYLAFPLQVYDHLLCFILCFIDKDNMDSISVSNINNMHDAAQQLRVLLERRSAENRLKQHYHRLKATLEELQVTKENLVHSEKMASIGQLAAGIAHEINNPLSYVLCNFSPMDEYVDTLQQSLSLHDKLVNEIDPEQNPLLNNYKQQFGNLPQGSELKLILEDLQAIVNDSRTGLLRVRDIINDLNSFAHKDTLETSTFGLGELLNETLGLLKYEIGDKIQVEQKGDSGQQLTTHRGFLQQILTNLIKNAAQALQSDNKDNARIIIDVQPTEAQLNIQVADNGPGIPTELKHKIFEPFFTTKSVGDGVGMGLSVTYNLAKKIGAVLELGQQQGELSTSFVLSIPKG